MATFERLPRALRDLRESRPGRVTQAALGRRAKVKASLISAYEGAKREPSITTLGKLLDALDADLLDLHYALTGEPRPPAPPDPSPEAEFLRTSAREAIEALKYIAMHGTVEGSDAGGTEGRGNGGTVPARGSAGHDRPRREGTGRPPAKAR